MRENRPYGLEGGESGSTGLPYPYRRFASPRPKKRLGCCRLTIWGNFRPCPRDAGRVELHKTAFLRHKPFCVSQMQRKSPSPLRKTTRFSHYGKNASFLKGSQYPQRTGARD
jgi:hypothetical protein